MAQLVKVGDGHDSGNNGDGDAQALHCVDEVEIGVWVIKVLSDCRIGACIGFGFEIVKVVQCVAGLWVGFRVCADL